MRYEYKEISRILEKYYNDNNYCGVASFCTATGLSVGKSYHLLRKHGRKTGGGTSFPIIVKALKEAGYSVESLHGKKMEPADLWYKRVFGYGITTYGQAEKKLRKGTYLVFNVTSKSAHVGCIKDGVLNDWTARSKRKTVRSVFKVVKTEE